MPYRDNPNKAGPTPGRDVLDRRQSDATERRVLAFGARAGDGACAGARPALSEQRSGGGNTATPNAESGRVGSDFSKSGRAALLSVDDQSDVGVMAHRVPGCAPCRGAAPEPRGDRRHVV